MPENNIEEPLKLQWIKGDKFGDVETVDKEEGEFTLFQGGGKIFTNLIPEFLTENIDPQMNALEASPKTNNTKKPPTKEEVETSPLRILLDKQKKLDKVPMGISFSINIPKKKVIEVLESTFDPQELHEELEKFIEDQLDIETVVSTIKDSVKILIQEKYKGV